jgi:hypothetical protein
MAVTFGQLPADVTALLGRIQNELFDVGADLANPVSPEPPAYQQLRIDESYVTALESACDEYNAALPVLRSFVLPGGTPGAALLHTARAVTRRAERTAWAAVCDHGETVSVSPARPTPSAVTCCGVPAATAEGARRHVGHQTALSRASSGCGIRSRLIASVSRRA